MSTRMEPGRVPHDWVLESWRVAVRPPVVPLLASRHQRRTDIDARELIDSGLFPRSLQFSIDIDIDMECCPGNELPNRRRQTDREIILDRWAGIKERP